jgi:proliferating cell nuclear antigen PCNA
MKQFALDVLVVMVNTERLYLQGLDSSHVCLFEVELTKPWFDGFQYTEGSDEPMFGVAPGVLDKALGTHQQGQSIQLEHTGGSATLVLRFRGGASDCIDKEFQLPLSAVTGHETMDVPAQEYDVDLTVRSKRFSNVVDQLLLFSGNVTVRCDEDNVALTARGSYGSMCATIEGDDDVVAYAILEDHVLEQSFSLRFLKMMVTFSGLSEDACLGWGDDKPMTLKYDLGDDSRVQFFMAPRVGE